MQSLYLWFFFVSIALGMTRNCLFEGSDANKEPNPNQELGRRFSSIEITQQRIGLLAL